MENSFENLLTTKENTRDASKAPGGVETQTRIEKIDGIIIPEGWTVLVHGGNLIKKQDNPYVHTSLVLKRSLSTVTIEEARRNNFQTAKGYSTAYNVKELPEEEFAAQNKPFEIRVIFYKPNWQSKSTNLPEEVRTKIDRYYVKNEQGGRHPFVPIGTTLIKIGVGIQNSDRDVFYFVPEDVLADYLKVSEISNAVLQAVADAYPEKRKKQEAKLAQNRMAHEQQRLEWEASITEAERAAVEKWNEIISRRVEEWNMDLTAARKYDSLILNADLLDNDSEEFHSLGKELSIVQKVKLIQNIREDFPFYNATWKNGRELPGALTAEKIVKLNLENK